MLKYFDRTFFRFLGRFLLIIIASLVVLAVTLVLSESDQSETSEPDDLLYPQEE